MRIERYDVPQKCKAQGRVLARIASRRQRVVIIGDLACMVRTVLALGFVGGILWVIL